MHNIPNVVHQRCGEVYRQSFTEVYSRICAVRNHASDMKFPRMDSLGVVSAAARFASRDVPRV